MTHDYDDYEPEPPEPPDVKCLNCGGMFELGWELYEHQHAEEIFDSYGMASNRRCHGPTGSALVGEDGR